MVTSGNTPPLLWLVERRRTRTKTIRRKCESNWTLTLYGVSNMPNIDPSNPFFFSLYNPLSFFNFQGSYSVISLRDLWKIDNSLCLTSPHLMKVFANKLFFQTNKTDHDNHNPLHVMLVKPAPPLSNPSGALADQDFHCCKY